MSLDPWAGFAYSTKETLENTKHFTRHVIDSDVPGVLVECGTFHCAQIACMQRVLLDKGLRRTVYGFDSFEGIPWACEEDAEQPGIGARVLRPHGPDKRELLKSSKIAVCPLQAAQRNLTRWFPKGGHENIILVKGWFQDTLRGRVEEIRTRGGIGLLRLDGDLYESTKVCMEQFFPLINDGGVLIIDDWALSGCRKAVEEYFAAAAANVTLVEPPHATFGPTYFFVHRDSK
jgi:O-methyltransferase